MSTILLAVLAVGASPAAIAPNETAANAVHPDVRYDSPLQLRNSWRDKVTVALREQATAEAGRQASAFQKVVDLLIELKTETRLSRTERQRLATKLQRRIVRVGPQHQALFQQGGGFAGGVLGGAGNDRSNGLVDLIQQTIDPESWEINGGPGTIAIFGQ